jgi:hypothetical protein
MGFRGEGNEVDAIDDENERITFDGSWELTHTDCDSFLTGGFWYDPTDQDAYHTFLFSDGSYTELDDWIVHRSADGWTGAAQSYGIHDMEVAWPDLEFDHVTHYETSLVAAVTQVEGRLSVTFSE